MTTVELTADQRRRLAAAISRHRRAVEAYLSAIDDQDDAPREAAEALAAELDLRRLMEALGVTRLPEEGEQWP